MTDRATSEAARALADVLQRAAESLGSDELDVLSDAMVQVRSAARGLAQSLAARGWGGGVLYGFGESGKVEDLATTEQEIAELLASGELEPGWDGSPNPLGSHLPTGRRVSIQARLDYVISDEVALRRYVRARHDTAPEKLVIDDELLIRNLVLVLAMLDGMERQDYAEHGLVMAGFQSLVRTVPRALDELSDDDAPDTYPTNRP